LHGPNLAGSVLAGGLLLMYAPGVRPVHGIPLFALALLFAGSCGSTTGDLPPVFPDPEPPPEHVVREPPSGFLGDPTDRFVHRVDCPRAASVDPAKRQFWAWPWEALDAGYAPCRLCEPMHGFR
jgi:hypothetical protein